jgi:phosphate transport system protein
MMKQHLHEELEQLKKSIALMGGRIEEAIQNAVTALVDRDASLAAEVIAGDQDIDMLELDIEKRCLNILATQQPFAADLRFITAVLRINHDMERMGDLAANIAREARRIAGLNIVYMPLNLDEMISEVRKMVRESLKALLERDTKLAREICRQDDIVDSLDSETSTKLIEIMKNSPENIEAATQLLLAVRHLERIADMATNIAEEVVFMVEGHNIKHHYKDKGDVEK